MKKFLALSLSVLTALSFCACGSSDAPSAENTEAKAETVQSAEQAPAPAAKETSKPEAEAKDITFDEIIVVDNEECLVKITGIDPDNLWGYTLKAYCENKSTEKNYMFSVDSAAVNGVQSDPFFAAEVAAGKKSNEEISFTDSDLEKNGITEYTDIELSFRIHDADDWFADAVAEVTVHVYPYGEENAAAFVREPQSTDTVLADNDYATVIVTGYSEDSIWGYTANLFFVNKSDKEIMFSADDVSVNGFMADPFFSTTVSAGKCAFSSMSWSDSTFEDNDITDVEEIEFLLRAHDSDDWFSSDYINETVTLNP